MKNPSKPTITKKTKKEITKGPMFKKSKANGKINLPNDVSIDENIVTKIKLGKSQPNNEKNRKKANKSKQLQKPTGTTSTPLKTKEFKAKPGIMSEQKQTVPKLSKASKNSLPLRVVTDDLATKAVNALRQVAEQQTNKKRMFEDESNVFAQIACIKIQNKKTTIKINLPHSTVASTGEICLITTDLKKGRKHDHEPSIDHWQEILRKAGVTQIKTVMPMRQLRVEYDQFELKRRLLTQHDFILVDSRIHSHVCHILGKIFFKKHNMLVPVRLDKEENIKKNIKFALNTTLLHLSEGPTSAVTIGHMGMTTKQLTENLLGLIPELAKKFPGGQQNIRSLGIKLPLSVTIPVYLTLRSKQTVYAPKIRTELPKKHMSVEGELSTIPGSVVKISPEGTIHVQRNKNAAFSDEEEEVSDSGEIDFEPKGKKQKIYSKDKQETEVITEDLNLENDESADGSDDNSENNESPDDDNSENDELLDASDVNSENDESADGSDSESDSN